MQQEIGSNFWICPEDTIASGLSIPSPSSFNCKGDDHVWLSTCRSAITLVIKTIEERNPNVNKTVLLPSFTCHTVYEPFMNLGYTVKTIPIDRCLVSHADDVFEIISNEEVGIVLFHRYFGFDTLPDIDKVVEHLHAKGIIVIEDCTQSMYSNFPRMDADYFVGNIRKWCGVPDGGFAVSRTGYFTYKPDDYDVDLEKAKCEAGRLKYKYLFEGIGDKDRYLLQYREAEDILINQSQLYKISPTSINIQSLLNVRNMKQVRVENYNYLWEGLNKIESLDTIFPIINDDWVPLYLPVLCEDRKVTQRKLVENAIYAPVVWPKATTCPPVCEDADYIYEHILCIPIDQRYDLDDMQRIINVLNG